MLNINELIKKAQASGISDIEVPSFIGSEGYYEIHNENGSITYQYMYMAGDTIVNDEPTQILVVFSSIFKHAPQRF